MAWKLSLEFSGITLLHLTKAAKGHRGIAYFSKGRTGNHRPFLYVPMEGLRDPRIYATPKLRKAFGLRVIAAPAGRYLMEVDLRGATVTFSQGVNSNGSISFQNGVAAGLDWNDLRYSADIKSLATVVNKGRRIEASKASGKVVLPAGTLVSLPAPPPGDPKRVYRLTSQEKNGKEVVVTNQPLADRHCLVVDCAIDRTRISVAKKSGHPLVLSFGPPDATSPIGLVFSSNCAAGSGTAEELSDYAPLLKTSSVTFRMGAMLATDDHACVSAVWID